MREIVFDTETTGLSPAGGDRMVEIGCIEMIGRVETGRHFHCYFNPERPMPSEAEAVHGLSDIFLSDKPRFADKVEELLEFIGDAPLVAHNASFDMNFLDMEFKRAGFVALSEVCAVTDTLAMAKSKHPGQKNSLDALVRRYEIPQRDRTFHGALLDAEILADVYLAMTGGQVSFDMDALSHSEQQNGQSQRQTLDIELAVIHPSAEELEAHETWVKQYQEKHGTPCLFAK